MGQPLCFGEVSCGPSQSLLGPLAVGNIDRRAHQFDNLPICIQDGMAYAIDVFNRLIRQHDSEFDIDIYLAIDRLVESLKDPVQVLRVCSLQRLLRRR